ncbi:MAG: class I SAM-dependent methyltransferase, partial [Candidatus Woesebacteria bacterium]|nr:class I SAM-dependent methyltransferase [Candidatus Woesebacteria bacterium]
DKIFERSGRDVISGVLKSRSGNKYPVRKGVPILLNRYTQPVKTVDSFAYEWEQFDFDYGKKGWLEDVVKPGVGGLNYFKNKVIIDCGSGSGRQSLWMAQAGAKLVFSLELSGAAQSITKKVADMAGGKVFVIQCDISDPPINTRNVKVDLIYCVNVIQHTINPKLAVLGITKLMNKKTDFIFNIYLKRNRKFILKTLELVRLLTRSLPFGLLKYLSLIATCIFYPFKRYLPVGHSFKEIWLNLYDILGNHEYQKFYTEEELTSILKNANLKIIRRLKYVMFLNKE